MRNFLSLWKQPSLRGHLNLKEIALSLLTSGSALALLEGLRQYTGYLGEWEPIGAAALVLILEILRKIRKGQD